MTTAIEAFTESVHDQFELLPVWPPGVEISIGDVGVIDDLVWSRVTTLEELGIEFRVDRDSSPVAQLAVTSGSGVDLEFIGDASGPTSLPGVMEGNVGFRATFHSSNGFFLQAFDTTVDRMKSTRELRAEMLRRYHGPDGLDTSWERDWIVVTEVMTAQRALVAVAAERKASVTVDLGAKIGAGVASIGDAEAKASLGVTSSMAAAHLATHPSALMFKGLKISGWGGSSVKVLPDESIDGSGGATPELVVEELTPHDLLT